MATKTPTRNPLLDLYTEAAARAGVLPEQLTRFVRAGVVLQERQLAASAAARECDKEDGPTEIGYGGARGGGKSHWLVAQMGIDDCQRHPGLKCLLLRKVGKANKENFGDLRKRLLMSVPHRYNQNEGILTFENGSQIIAGHFQNDKDVDAYLGLEYDVIGVEEATTLTETKYRDIRTCNRSSKDGWRPRMYSTTNPGGVGHAWYKSLFITPFQKHQEKWTRFVSATATDNRFLNKEYVRSTLESLTGWKRKAWLEGDWDIAAGQFFTNFRREIVPDGGRSPIPWHVIPSRCAYELPKSNRYGIALDYGFNHYTTCYLLTKDGDDNITTVDEYGARGVLVPGNADSIHAMLKRHQLRLSDLTFQVAGHDLFAQRGNDTGKTIADQYKAEGFNFQPANIDRIAGAGEILNRLGDHESTPPIPPRYFIMERCANLIETLPLLEHDPRRPEDVLKWDIDENGTGGDDWYDGNRYGVMAFVEKRKQGNSTSISPASRFASSPRIDNN